AFLLPPALPVAAACSTPFTTDSSRLSSRSSRLRVLCLGDSTPLFPQCVQPRPLQILRTHHHPNLHIRPKRQKPRLRQRRNLRRIRQIHDHHRHTVPILFRKIRRLGLERLQTLPHLR